VAARKSLAAISGAKIHFPGFAEHADYFPKFDLLHPVSRPIGAASSAGRKRKIREILGVCRELLFLRRKVD
jgi:hypothetical protein